VVQIVTQRLVLRPFRAEDLPAFVAYRSDPEVARYQSWDQSYAMADAERFMVSQRGVDFGTRGQWLQLAAIDRSSDVLCGDCGVCIKADQPSTAEIGVTFAPDHQRLGLATEALGALTTELFDELDLHRIYAQADERNHAVHRLLAGLGYRQEARLIDADLFKGEWTTLSVFAVLAAEWQPANP
jgi:RimJ/RimL family protein N-acetyltransferase